VYCTITLKRAAFYTEKTHATWAANMYSVAQRDVNQQGEETASKRETEKCD